MCGLLLMSHPPYSFHCLPIVIYLVLHLYIFGVWRIILASNRGYYYLGGSGAELYWLAPSPISLRFYVKAISITHNYDDFEI
jgi:hypothetical protein